MTRKIIEWDLIEIQYRSGMRSLKDIGLEFGVSDAAIIKRAKRDSWTRDLGRKIQAKAEAKVSAALVSGKVSALTKLRERQLVEVNAEAIAAVRIEHRTSIRRHKAIAEKLFAELDAQSGEDVAPLMSQLGELMRNPDDRGMDKLHDLYLKSVSLPERAKTFKTLTESARIWIDLERDAYNIPKPATGAPDPAASGEERKRFILQFVQPSHAARGDEK